MQVAQWPGMALDSKQILRLSPPVQHLVNAYWLLSLQNLLNQYLQLNLTFSLLIHACRLETETPFSIITGESLLDIAMLMLRISKSVDDNFAPSIFTEIEQCFYAMLLLLQQGASYAYSLAFTAWSVICLLFLRIMKAWPHWCILAADVTHLCLAAESALYALLLTVWQLQCCTVCMKWLLISDNVHLK